MSDDNGTATADSGGSKKLSCFVISAFGTTQEDKRARTQVLKHLVGKVLSPRGYDVVRADQIADEGLITNHIIEHLLEDDLVVADLTGLNPNVFYEMAVRHAARKPIVHLITHGVSIPFDVANMRAVQYALDDPDRLEEAQKELKEKVKAIEDSQWKAAPNPITSVRNVAILRESEEPETREVGEVLAAVNELRDEVQTLNRRVTPPGDATRRLREAAAAQIVVDDRIRRLVTGVGGKPCTFEEIVEETNAPSAIVLRRLETMEAAKEVYQLKNGTWSDTPF